MNCFFTQAGHSLPSMVHSSWIISEEESLKNVVLSTMMLMLIAATLVACGGEAPTPTPIPQPTQIPVENTPMQNTSGQAGHITVPHILIGVKHAVVLRG